MAGALTGFRILDLTAMISGPLATMLLGDQGADVIKVEPPGTGDLVREIGATRAGIAPIFATSNRNKRSIAIDLKSADGLVAVKRLAERCDVFVQNFRPGAAERIGVGEAAIREHRSDIVYVSISGFGETGPYAQKRVYDPVIQALSGLAAIQGDRETGRPRMVRTIVPDKLTAVTAAQAITAALLARERSGEGQHVKLSMLDAMVSFLWPEAMARYTLVGHGGNEVKARAIKQVRDLVFETTDGYVTAGVVANREWKALAEAVGHPEWLADARFETPGGRVAHWDERLDLMQQAFSRFSTKDLLELLDRAEVPCAPINARADLLADPQIVANELIVETEHPQAGTVRQTRPAARFEKTPAELRLPAPALGQHTDEILSEVGFSNQEIQTLRSAGYVA